MFKGIRTAFNENIYLILGVLIGLYLSAFLSETFNVHCNNPVPQPQQQQMQNETPQELGAKLKIAAPKKPSDIKKSKLIRPRYYSTELGIKEKLFVGIFTSEEKVNSQAIHINKTIAHLVDKIKYFITAQYKLRTKFNLTGLVGFTDSRIKFRPFQIIKYVADTFGQDYDYYFFASDYTYINAHKLKDSLNKISVSNDVYLGTRVKDGSYCNLHAGILISNSILKAMRNRLDWCVLNAAISDDHSESIGRCIYHSLGLSCQESIQGERIPSIKIKHFEIGPNLSKLSATKTFNDAVTIYPVAQHDDFYLLNAYFLRQRLTQLQTETANLLTKVESENWPPGQRIGAKPATRFDLVRDYYFNMTHLYLADDFTNVRKHNEAELLDIENVIEEVKAKVAFKQSKELLYRRLVNGYRKFDLSRGMDYTLDLGFRDLRSGKEVIKRFEVCKPLGKVEVVSAPYVTENARVTVLLPIEENQVPMALEFLQSYVDLIMDRKEKSFLMLVLLYQFGSDSKGSKDVFEGVKNFALKTTAKFRNDNNKIAWVSIRFPDERAVSLGEYEVLNFAIVDLALRKVGLESLVLVLDVYCNVTVDFLNRVRMNTIMNYQIFSPIPFRQYNPKISHIKSLDINKSTGHFDKEEYKFIAFYGKDYVLARKKYQHIVPLIRIDNDVSYILKDDYKSKGNLFEMFVKYRDTLHCMRATEMSLRVKYHEETNKSKANLFLGNNAQLAKLLLTKQSEISL